MRLAEQAGWGLCLPEVSLDWSVESETTASSLQVLTFQLTTCFSFSKVSRQVPWALAPSFHPVSPVTLFPRPIKTVRFYDGFLECLLLKSPLALLASVNWVG